MGVHLGDTALLTKSFDFLSLSPSFASATGRLAFDLTDGLKIPMPGEIFNKVAKDGVKIPMPRTLNLAGFSTESFFRPFWLFNMTLFSTLLAFQHDTTYCREIQ